MPPTELNDPSASTLGFQTKSFVKGFDLFSKPFVFFVGDKKSKSTFIGGALSLSILLVSIVYFYYLMNLYLSNKIEPKITSSIEIENDYNEIIIAENFFYFEMLIQGEPLNQYESRVGKKFLTMYVYYEKYNKTGTEDYWTIPIVPCTNENFIGFLCMDETAIEGLDIYLQPIEKTSSDYALSIMPCDETVETNCATPEEIYATIFQSSNYFSIFTKIKQYNPSERRFKDAYKSEYFYFDPNSIAYTRISLIKANTSVLTGPVIQLEENEESIYDIKRIDTYFSQENLYERMGLSGYAYIVFELNQLRNVIVIQHAMITEVLAQFMSIFNSLLTVGILARMLAESHIVEDMNNILLKEYYKKTAMQLMNRHKQRKTIAIESSNKIKQQQQQLQQQQQQPPRPPPPNSSESKNNITNRFYKDEKVSAGAIASSAGINNSTEQEKKEKNSITKHTFNQAQVLLMPPQSRVSTDGIVACSKKIENCDFAEKQTDYFQISIFERVKIFITQTLGLSHSNPASGEKNDSDTAIYKNLLKQSTKRINIFEVYKDIIRLKMAIKLILTKDQFAAIQFCGSEIRPDEIDADELLSLGHSNTGKDSRSLPKTTANKQNRFSSSKQQQQQVPLSNPPTISNFIAQQSLLTQVKQKMRSKTSSFTYQKPKSQGIHVAQTNNLQNGVRFSNYIDSDEESRRVSKSMQFEPVSYKNSDLPYSVMQQAKLNLSVTPKSAIKSKNSMNVRPLKSKQINFVMPPSCKKSSENHNASITRVESSEKIKHPAAAAATATAEIQRLEKELSEYKGTDTIQNLKIHGDCVKESSISLDLSETESNQTHFDENNNHPIQENHPNHQEVHVQQQQHLQQKSKLQCCLPEEDDLSDDTEENSDEKKERKRQEKINQQQQQLQQEEEEAEEEEEFDIEEMYSHLADMDEIEEDDKAKEKFLKVFLNKISSSNGNTNNSSISHVDKQIYQSLIIDQFEGDSSTDLLAPQQTEQSDQNLKNFQNPLFRSNDFLSPTSMPLANSDQITISDRKL